MREIINLQVGQCGNQIGAKFWEQICVEHNINEATGELMTFRGKRDVNDCLQVYFNESDSGGWVPRSVMIDLEPGPINSILGSPMGNLYRPENSISGHAGGAANIWAKGHYTEGCEILAEVLDAVRREAERCDSLQGFQLVHSLGGGTGSGLGTKIAVSLNEEFGNQTIISFSVAPSVKVSNVITEPYNSLLTLKYLAENVTATVMLDNQALQNICLYSLKLKHNSHGDLNQLVSQVMSGVTTSLRYPGQLNADLRKLAFNLVPFPALHFLLCNTGPLYTRSCLDYGGCSIGHLIREMFSVKNMMADCDPIRGRYLAVAGIFRGEKIAQKQVEESLCGYQCDHNCEFVDWIPDGVKTAVCNVAPHKGDMTATFLGNNTAIREVFLRLSHQFTQMYSRKAYVHFYTQEGMDIFEFDEAKTDVENLMNDYQLCQQTRSEDHMELRTKKR